MFTLPFVADNYEYCAFKAQSLVLGRKTTYKIVPPPVVPKNAHKNACISRQMLLVLSMSRRKSSLTKNIPRQKQHAQYMETLGLCWHKQIRSVPLLPVPVSTALDLCLVAVKKKIKRRNGIMLSLLRAQHHFVPAVFRCTNRSVNMKSCFKTPQIVRAVFLGKLRENVYLVGFLPFIG